MGGEITAGGEPLGRGAVCHRSTADNYRHPQRNEGPEGTAGAGWKLTWQKDLERCPLAGKFCYFKILFLLKGAEPLQAQGDWIRRREGSGE